MLRLYHFDLARNTIDVETLAPWILAQPPASRNTLAAREARLTTSVDNFSMPIDFSSRFAGFLPVPGRPARPASEVLVPGTLAYWRFDAGGHHPDQPAHASLRFVGGKNPLHGAYLTTAASAFLNKETFTRGYTIEAFVKFPLDWDAGNNGWMSVLARRGAAGQAGKHSKNTDPQEPVGALSISNNGREPQFNVYPLNQASPTTNWGHGLVELQWWHIAVVNDGTHTRMYVESSPVVDNPSTPSNGIATLNLPWLVGGHEYAGAVDQVFHGWIGDVRVVNRPLSPRDFLTAK
jgi:hypothetical protein